LNKLTHIKYEAKQSYYENLIKENQVKSYRTWSIINELIDYKNKKHTSKLPLTMKVYDHTYKTNWKDFLNKLCNYFATQKQK